MLACVGLFWCVCERENASVCVCVCENAVWKETACKSEWCAGNGRLRKLHIFIRDDIRRASWSEHGTVCLEVVVSIPAKNPKIENSNLHLSTQSFQQSY